MRLKFSASSYITGIFLAVWFLILSSAGSIALAETLTDNSISAVVSQIKQNDVIYLGENHDSASIHQQQLAIITQLYENLANSEQELAIALEMFQRPFQPILNHYLAQEIDEAELRKQTEYDTRWGFDWELYAPILRFAQAKQISLIALNTPTEITRKVATSGIDSLAVTDFRYIPPVSDIRLDNPEYRQRLLHIYQQHVEDEQGNSKEAENFYTAQVLWDETMAEAIALYYQNHPQVHIAVLVGKAHVIYDYAIPERVARRINSSSFTQTSFLFDQNP